MPFWKGEAIGRPLELGRAVGRVRPGDVRGWTTRRPATAPRAAGLDEWAVDNLLAYLREQREATRHVPERPHDPRRALPRRAGRLAARRALPVRRAGQRPVGAGDRGADARAARGRGARGSAPTTASCCGCPTRSTTPAPRSCRPPRTCCSTRTRSSRSWSAELGGSSLYAVPVPGVRGPGAAAAPPRPDAPHPAVAAAPEGRRSCSRVAGRYEQFPVTLEAMRECVQDVYDLPGPARADGRRAAAGGAGGRGGHAGAVAVRAQPAVRLRRDVPLRGGRAAGRAPGRRAVAGLHAAGRAARARRRSAELLDPEVLAEVEASLQRTRPGPARPRRRGRGRPAALPRRPHHRRGGGPRGARGVAGRAGVRAPGHPGADRRRGALARRSRTPGGCATRWAPRCRSACRRRSPSRSPTRSATSCSATPAPTGRSRRPSARARFGLGVAVVAGVLDRLVGVRAAGPRRAASRAAVRTAPAVEYCDAEVLRRLRRASLARLRAEVEPVEQRALGRFLPGLAGGADPRRGDGAAGCGGRPAPRTCWAWWSSSPGRRCPRARWSR